MEASPNQYTEPMTTHEAPRSSLWVRTDTRLVIEEGRLSEAQQWADHDSPLTHAEPPYDHIETKVGHALMFGKITIEEALELV